MSNTRESLTYSMIKQSRIKLSKEKNPYILLMKMSLISFFSIWLSVYANTNHVKIGVAFLKRVMPRKYEWFHVWFHLEHVFRTSMASEETIRDGLIFIDAEKIKIKWRFLKNWDEWSSFILHS